MMLMRPIAAKTDSMSASADVSERDGFALPSDERVDDDCGSDLGDDQSELEDRAELEACRRKWPQG